VTDQEPLDAPWPTRMTRIVESAQHVATAMDKVQAAITDAAQALGHLHAVMQDAGLIPDDQADIGRHRDDAVQRLAGALDIPPELITGSPDVHHWTAWAMTADTQTIPTVTDDGRAQACPECLPEANYLINQRCPDCGHPWAYAGRFTGCAMPVKPGTTTPAVRGEDAHRCNCPALPTYPAEQEPAPQPHPEQPSTSG